MPMLQALAAGEPMSERVTGAALLADISCFTPLTEALATRARAGATCRGADRGPGDRPSDLFGELHAMAAASLTSVAMR